MCMCITTLAIYFILLLQIASKFSISFVSFSCVYEEPLKQTILIPLSWICTCFACFLIVYILQIIEIQFSLSNY